jgi:TolB-like protein/Tfp pilus assembly protein PilF
MGDPEAKVPQHDAPGSVGQPSRAVFLSYASGDAPAAERIAMTLCGAGIQVWFDKSELRGGDAWDRHIRQQIHDCRLFIAVISAHTEARDEGYFRREWRLAVERAGDMAEDKTFVVPVAVDGTSERSARVPDSFKHVQWTRLAGGETTPAFVQRMQRLLSPEPPTTSRPATGEVATAPVTREPSRASWWSTPGTRAIVATLGSVLVSLVAYKFWSPTHVTEPPAVTSAAPATAPTATAAAFDPPPHSIAVLPFVNMSGDASQDYFADGLTEELLNSLTEVHELQVAARTSAFAFKGKDTDIGTIARRLNVGAVLEGSVRRSGRTVRVTAQLINSVSGFHLWSHAYDHDLGDVLKLQTEIAEAVANALKVTMLSGIATKIELGGTHNPAALDAYLRAGKVGRKDLKAAIATYAEATRLDPNYALAFATRSLTLSNYATTSSEGVRESFDQAQQDALKAIALAPDLAVGHVALAVYFELGALDFARATNEYERALSLAPGDVLVLERYSNFAAYMGHTEAGILAARRAVVLDPLNHNAHRLLGDALLIARQYDEAVAAYQDSLALVPDDPTSIDGRTWAYYGLGNLQSAKASCESTPSSQICLAMIYHKLGRPADAHAMLAKVRASYGDAAAYQYAQIYAQWSKTSDALAWLEKAMQLRDPGLEWMKTDPLLDPLRNEPRFQAIEKALRFPD